MRYRENSPSHAAQNLTQPLIDSPKEGAFRSVMATIEPKNQDQFPANADYSQNKRHTKTALKPSSITEDRVSFVLMLAPSLRRSRDEMAE